MQKQLYQYDSVFGYRFIPGLKARINHEGGGYLVRVNSDGFRSDHEFLAKKEPNIYRIMLFGDSYTAGDGVSNKYRYSDILEQRLPDLQVYNFGLSGTGTDQQYLIFHEYAKKIEHDLVIIGVLVENVRRVAARYRMSATDEGELILLPKPYFTFDEDRNLILHHVPVPRLIIKKEDFGKYEKVDKGGRFYLLHKYLDRLYPTWKERASKHLRYQPFPQYNSPKNHDWLLMSTILKKWVRESPKPVVVVPIPTYHYIEGVASARKYRACFNRLASDVKIILHDPLDDLLAYSPDQQRNFRFRNDYHLTPFGHEALAMSLIVTIKEYIEEHYI